MGKLTIPVQFDNLAKDAESAAPLLLAAYPRIQRPCRPTAARRHNGVTGDGGCVQLVGWRTAFEARRSGLCATSKTAAPDGPTQIDRSQDCPLALPEHYIRSRLTWINFDQNKTADVLASKPPFLGWIRFGSGGSK